VSTGSQDQHREQGPRGRPEKQSFSGFKSKPSYSKSCPFCQKSIPQKYETCYSCRFEQDGKSKAPKDEQSKTNNSFSALYEEEVPRESKEHADARIAEKSPSRTDKNNGLIEAAMNEEAAKYAPALDSKQDADGFVPEHRVSQLIQVCKIEDISMSDLMCQIFVDQKIDDLKNAVINFNVPELIMPTPNYGGILEKLGEAFIWINDKCSKKFVVPDELAYHPPTNWRNDLWDEDNTILDRSWNSETNRWENRVFDMKTKEYFWEPEGEPVFDGPSTLTYPDNQNPNDLPDYYFLDEGNVCEFATTLISQVCAVISPVVSICNPINYIRCAVRSSRIIDAKVVAEYEGSISVNDSRACDLQEFQDMHTDTLSIYRYKVMLFDGENWDSVPAAYFPKIADRERYPWYVRYFTMLPEPRYKSVVLSMNMIKELYHAKTCSVNLPEDSFRVMNRMFLNNPHNTFTEEALTGDRILECNFEFSCMFCQNSYNPVEKCSPVK